MHLDEHVGRMAQHVEETEKEKESWTEPRVELTIPLHGHLFFLLCCIVRRRNVEKEEEAKKLANEVQIERMRTQQNKF